MADGEIQPTAPKIRNQLPPPKVAFLLLLQPLFTFSQQPPNHRVGGRLFLEEGGAFYQPQH